MQSKGSIVNIPLLMGLLLSIAVHVAALYSKGIYTPPEPHFEAGRTVVHLTLAPALASQAAAPAPRNQPEPVETENEMVEEAVPPTEPPPEPEAARVPEPIPEEVPMTPSVPVSEKRSVDSMEQDASLIENKGVISEAAARTSIRPVYPRVSRVRGEEGEVTLSIQVLASGKTGTIEVLKSSGHKRLDAAACKAARNAAFTPATQFGRKIDSVTELSITFRLTDD